MAGNPSARKVQRRGERVSTPTGGLEFTPHRHWWCSHVHHTPLRQDHTSSSTDGTMAPTPNIHPRIRPPTAPIGVHCAWHAAMATHRSHSTAGTVGGRRAEVAVGWNNHPPGASSHAVHTCRGSTGAVSTTAASTAEFSAVVTPAVVPAAPTCPCGGTPIGGVPGGQSWSRRPRDCGGTRCCREALPLACSPSDPTDASAASDAIRPSATAMSTLTVDTAPHATVDKGRGADDDEREG